MKFFKSKKAEQPMGHLELLWLLDGKFSQFMKDEYIKERDLLSLFKLVVCDKCNLVYVVSRNSGLTAKYMHADHKKTCKG